MGDATNKQLRTLMIISIALSVAAIAIAVWGKKTIQLTADSTGSIHTGEMKQHLKFK